MAILDECQRLTDAASRLSGADEVTAEHRITSLANSLEALAPEVQTPEEEPLARVEEAPLAQSFAPAEDDGA